jgi:hypothetical protein
MVDYFFICCVRDYVCLALPDYQNDKLHASHLCILFDELDGDINVLCSIYYLV